MAKTVLSSPDEGCPLKLMLHRPALIHHRPFYSLQYEPSHHQRHFMNVSAITCLSIICDRLLKYSQM